MIAPIRVSATTRAGTAYYVGDREVFVPGEAFYRKSRIAGRTVEIKYAGFVEEWGDGQRPKRMSQLDEETREIITCYLLEKEKNSKRDPSYIYRFDI